MASSTEICNLALSHIGISAEIANLETERSPEAAACRRFYTTALDATLRDFDWPFATKVATLGLIEATSGEEWAYTYRYPTDCVKIRRILNGVRNPVRTTRTPYRIGQDSSGLLIYTDYTNAEVEYTLRASDPSRYPSDFVIAFSFRLAAYIAPRITGGDPFKLADAARRSYDYEIHKAWAAAAEEEQTDVEPEAEYIRARE